MTPPPHIRLATPVERPHVVATVTAAFAQDPAWAFLLGDEYGRLAPQFAGTLFDVRVGSGSVWVSEDLATVAMWDAPGQADNPPQWVRDAWARYRASAGEQAHQRLVAYDAALTAVAPSEPYWYLGVLATQPARQREGLASAVMGPAIERADRDRVACCLETSRVANRRFYEGRGFVEARDVSLAHAPPTWWLRRPVPS